MNSRSPQSLRVRAGQDEGVEGVRSIETSKLADEFEKMYPKIGILNVACVIRSLMLEHVLSGLFTYVHSES